MNLQRFSHRLIARSLLAKQKGDFLIESMIGVLLMGLVGTGITMVTSKVAVSQGRLAQQQQVIGELRNLQMQGPKSFCQDMAIVTSRQVSVTRTAGCNSGGTVDTAVTVKVDNDPTTVVNVDIPMPVTLTASVDFGGNAETVQVGIGL